MASSQNMEEDAMESLLLIRRPLVYVRTSRKPPLFGASYNDSADEDLYLQPNVTANVTEAMSSVGPPVDMQDVEQYEDRSPRLEDQTKFAAEFGSPKTPYTAGIPPVLECPEPPLVRSRDLTRQGSLNDTKLLMTTKLKRTASFFTFDKHFEYIREIGRGSFSRVYEARDRRRGISCAIKKSKQQFRCREDRDRFMREVGSVAGLSEHPNVVKYYRCWQQDSYFYTHMELCEGGNMRSFLDGLNDLLPESQHPKTLDCGEFDSNPSQCSQVWAYIDQVASGLAHIHSSGILHLDIKPDNILIDSQGFLKIGDFSLAVTQSQWDWEEGDGGYVAPELLREEEPGPEADMYSFGAMAYEWATGKMFPRSNQDRDLIQIPASRSDALRSLVCALLNPFRDKRPSAADVLKWRNLSGN